MNNINPKDLERLLRDSRESTITELDELCYLRMVIRCMASGMTYAEAMESTHEQLTRSINDE